MSFPRQEPENPNQESSPHHQQQPHHLHLHQNQEPHLQSQQHPPHQHDHAAHQQEDILAFAFDSYPPYMQEAYLAQLGYARRDSAANLDITYQLHENVSPFDPSAFNNPVSQGQQMADHVAGAPVGRFISHHDPAEVNISGKSTRMLFGRGK